MRTVKEVAELSGTTVRTLHHYDEIGLLRPNERSEAGYRLYSHADLERLQEILGWRALGFALSEIAVLVDDSHYDRAAEFTALMEAGVDPGGPEAAAVAMRHREYLSRWFYQCTPQIHHGLAEMYVADPRFCEEVERLRAGARDVRAGCHPGCVTRVCSLLPSATEIVAELGLIDSLVAVSEECKWPAEVQAKPRVTAARVDSANLSSAEIDRVVRASISDGRPLYAVDAELIDELQPDVVITQDLCSVCAVSSGDLATACPVGAEVISLDPRTLDEVGESIVQLAARLGVAQRGAQIAAQMRARIEAVRAGSAGRAKRRVFVAEWLDPPFTAGHWVPEMVDAAGGVDVLGEAGQPSRTTSWDEVMAAQPEVIIAAPCGYDREGAAARAAFLDLGVPVVAVDADSYFSRPGPRLADGTELLAEILRPGLH